MATKKQSASRRSETVRPARGKSAQVTVRMYRQGLGDCFLIGLPRRNGRFWIMIDCGVILGTKDPASKMAPVVDDIAATTNGKVDLLLATHEHWDHLSGFVQVQDLFKKKLKFDRVWLAWTEDPDDEDARSLRKEHQALRLALSSAAARMRMSGASVGQVDSMLEFFGAAGQGTTADALKFIKSLGKPRFCRPDDKPTRFEDVPATFYVLGPPRDLKMLKRYNPSKAHPETYGLAAQFLSENAPQITDFEANSPFDPIARVPFEAAQQMPFFQKRYWGAADAEPGKEVETDQSWRRIDGDWLDSTSAMALQLDSATNNTSLVLAIELDDGRVLLFPADAQVGNWLSWQELTWKVDDKDVTGPDLIARTVFYKTGHHGSHNATLKEKGLEMMKNLEIAMIPVDHEMAVKKGWSKMPLDEIEKRLKKKTGNRVLRVDMEVPVGLKGKVAEDPGKSLYYEITI